MRSREMLNRSTDCGIISSMIDKIKKHALSIMRADPYLAYMIDHHIPEVERWANILLKRFPKADKKVVLAAVYLHDIGHQVDKKAPDHAVVSEIKTRTFLPTIDADPVFIEKVASAVRSHRNADVAPRTLEDKILAVADSLSHMTDIVYIDRARKGQLEQAKQKLERDFRDTTLLPGVQKEFRPLYNAWKTLLETLPPR